MLRTTSTSPEYMQEALMEIGERTVQRQQFALDQASLRAFRAHLALRVAQAAGTGAHAVWDILVPELRFARPVARFAALPRRVTR